MRRGAGLAAEIRLACRSARRRLPGLKTVDGIAEVSGNYPSKGGRGERAAWFRDSEGNMLGIGQPI